ncbi:uncharacterized protein MKK02DRAFT_30605 [Dioszegia hungarica]|uniref:Uncharacterized protein n=1 Tax=Dioszegia hungarica TaxID=4972 RepID=A0AA38LSQ2_9TREE|nr:uncharacterized protein MKK02DRAFT_30605 [Dioszegia hungarica]KAI9632879.1 hypothetical protein MKK02DRAFT_30605 [Dioszegia hungarica]
MSDTCSTPSPLTIQLFDPDRPDHVAFLRSYWKKNGEELTLFSQQVPSSFDDLITAASKHNQLQTLWVAEKTSRSSDESPDQSTVVGLLAMVRDATMVDRYGPYACTSLHHFAPDHEHSALHIAGELFQTAISRDQATQIPRESLRIRGNRENGSLMVHGCDKGFVRNPMSIRGSWYYSKVMMGPAPGSNAWRTVAEYVRAGWPDAAADTDSGSGLAPDPRLRFRRIELDPGPVPESDLLVLRDGSAHALMGEMGVKLSDRRHPAVSAKLLCYIEENVSRWTQPAPADEERTVLIAETVTDTTDDGQITTQIGCFVGLTKINKNLPSLVNEEDSKNPLYLISKRALPPVSTTDFHVLYLKTGYQDPKAMRELVRRAVEEVSEGRLTCSNSDYKLPWKESLINSGFNMVRPATYWSNTQGVRHTFCEYELDKVQSVVPK